MVFISLLIEGKQGYAAGYDRMTSESRMALSSPRYLLSIRFDISWFIRPGE